MTTCVRCGGEVHEGDAFCRNCGATAGVATDQGPAAIVEDPVWPDGSPALEPYEPLDGRARWARLLLGGAVVLAVVTIPLQLDRADAFETYLATGDPSDLETSDDLFAALALPSAAIGLATIVMFLRWFSRAYRNLPAIGIRRLRFTPGWAIGSWFVPFLNLWRPKSITNDLWRTGDPELPSGVTTEWRGRPVGAVVHWWWGIYVASFVRFTLALNDADVVEQADADGARQEAFYSLLTAIAGVLAIVVVARITERQRERAERAGAA
ncbi:MAG: DUF4328 domain-containing protein [Actinomycetota bacterium]